MRHAPIRGVSVYLSVFFLLIFAAFVKKNLNEKKTKHIFIHKTVELIFPFIYTVSDSIFLVSFYFVYNTPFIGIKQSIPCSLVSLPKRKNSANFLSKNRAYFPLVE